MLRLKNVSKRFRDNEIIKDTNYLFEEGKIYLIRGKNGVGKTVLLKILCGLMKPTTGKVEYNDKDINNQILNYGVIIETPVFWKDKTGYETLEFLASIRNEIGKEDIDKVLEIVGLSDVKNKNVKKYSLGMKQRLGIAQAIMENPKIILFDEPTNSLDDDGVEMFKKVLLAEREKGKLIIVVSHNIEEIQDISDYTLYLKNNSLYER